MIDQDFLLSNSIAKELFHGIAKDLPLIDYHCHIDPLTLDRKYSFPSITDLWILKDPYKHRAMRINGVPEDEITGNASSQRKFQRWIETLDKCAGNPLFHWSYMELNRFFDWNTYVSPEHWESLWTVLNQKVQGLTTGTSIDSLRAEYIITSDSLCADLNVHKELNLRNFRDKPDTYRVLPSLRGDEVLAFEQKGFSGFISSLEQKGNSTVKDLSSYFDAVINRLHYFHNQGCRIADHALDRFRFYSTNEAEAKALFHRALKGPPLSFEEANALRSFMLLRLLQIYSELGWILCLHMGALRNTSQRLRILAGPAGGYASIDQGIDLLSVVRLLDSAEQENHLPRTILFPLNPVDYPAIATLTGSFTEDGVPGKVQFGPAWWYNDHRWGIQLHLEVLSAYSLLERFIGMTTDSRSILSLLRHEYFRRVFCSYLGALVEKGEIPNKGSLLERILRAVCYENARNWINHN